MSLSPTEFARAAATGAIRAQTDFTKVKSSNRIPEGSSPSGTPFWGEDPESWDSIVIKGQRMPGVASVKGKGFSQRIDRKKAPGRNGHTVTHLGLECAKIEIILEMWTEEHLRTFEKLIPLLKPRAKSTRTVDRYKLAGADTPGLSATVQRSLKKTNTNDRSGFQALTASLKTKQKMNVTEGGPEPVPVYHPALSLFRIRAVVILSCSFPEPKGDASKGIYQVRLDCEEFVSGAGRNGSVSTKKKAPDITSLGPGAITRKLQATTPADDNTQP